MLRSTLALVAAGGLFATTASAWPANVDIPGLAANGDCPVSLVKVNANETLMSQEVRPLAGGACRFSSFRRVTEVELRTEVSALPRRPLYVQATNDLPYRSLARVLNSIQDGGNYAVILSNIPL